MMSVQEGIWINESDMHVCGENDYNNKDVEWIVMHSRNSWVLYAFLIEYVCVRACFYNKSKAVT